MHGFSGESDVTTSSRSRIGSELRNIREAMGISGTAVAKDLGWSQSKVSRVETGRFGATLGELATLLDYYAVPEEVRAEILAAAAHDDGVEGAWMVRAGGPRRRQSEMAAIEERVQELRQYQVLLLPGLLQCPAYTEALLEARGFPDAAATAERRRQRQSRFVEGSDATYEVILDERALRRWPGDAVVHRQQLDHILGLVKAGRVAVYVLASSQSAGSWAVTPFILYTFREAPPLVMCETQTADLYLSAAADIETYEDLFARLKAEALDVDESARFLKGMRQQLD